MNEYIGFIELEKEKKYVNLFLYLYFNFYCKNWSQIKKKLLMSIKDDRIWHW